MKSPYLVGQLVMFKRDESKIANRKPPKNGFYIVLRIIDQHLLICPAKFNQADLISLITTGKEYQTSYVNLRNNHLYPSCLNFQHKINHLLIPKNIKL